MRITQNSTFIVAGFYSKINGASLYSQVWCTPFPCSDFSTVVRPKLKQPNGRVIFSFIRKIVGLLCRARRRPFPNFPWTTITKLMIHFQMPPDFIKKAFNYFFSVCSLVYGVQEIPTASSFLLFFALLFLSSLGLSLSFIIIIFNDKPTVAKRTQT